MAFGTSRHTLRLFKYLKGFQANSEVLKNYELGAEGSGIAKTCLLQGLTSSPLTAQRRCLAAFSPSLKGCKTSLWTQIRPWSQQPICLGGAAPQPIQTDDEIVLTDNAIEKLHELCKGQGGQYLRLTVEAGGCSGFSYKFDLDSEIAEGDRVFEAGGVKLVADSMSFEFVRGSKVDYSQELIKSSFEVVDNPNADKGCGCGTSFSPK